MIYSLGLYVQLEVNGAYIGFVILDKYTGTYIILGQLLAHLAHNCLQGLENFPQDFRHHFFQCSVSVVARGRN